MNFSNFKEEFEEFINCGEVYESDITDFSTDKQIEISQLADDFGSLCFSKFSKFTIKKPQIN